MKINRNMSAVIANKQLKRTENRLSASMQRLTSGLNINSAGDNPAGMAISNKMKAQIDALDLGGLPRQTHRILDIAGHDHQAVLVRLAFIDGGDGIIHRLDYKLGIVFEFTLSASNRA